MAASALVTGASSGIGLELARLLARDGHDVVMCARDESALARLAEEISSGWGVRAHVVPADLSEASNADEVWRQATEMTGPIDVLVNNAGFGTHGPFHRDDPERMVQEINLNVVTLTKLTRLCLPAMAERGAGRVLNVSSTAAFQPGPFMAVYYATKAYVLNFSEALSEELRGSGVTVTCLCPGPTESRFQERAGIEGVRLVRSKVFMADARSVAQAGYEGMMAGRRLVVPGLFNRACVLGSKLSPRPVSTWTVRKLHEH